jgi:hypothetical protein
MAFPTTQKDRGERAARHLKTGLKRAKMTYEDLAKMEEHGFKVSRTIIASKLFRGMMPAAFFPAALVAIGVGAVKLEDT